MIRAVFMDIDNTLLDFDAAAQEGMEHCFDVAQYAVDYFGDHLLQFS